MRGRKKSVKHKKAKQDKVKQLDLARMSGEEARHHVESLIAKGRPREAIQALQQLHLADSPEYELLRMRAQAARARQLKEKGLDQEAAVLLDMVSVQLSKIDSSRCPEIAQVIAEAPLDFGLHYYEQHRSIHSTCPSIEQALADQVVFSNGWESLGSLPDESPLKKDGLILAGAIPDLDVARWQEGLAKLDSLSRKSVFAPWKLFAKAMVSAYKGEEEDLQRALKQIPETFPLRSTVRILSEKGSQGIETLQKEARRPDEEMAQAIVKAIRTQDRQLPQLITQFAHKLFPQNQAMAVRSLSETTAFALMMKDVGPERIGKLIPPDFAKPILMRIKMFSAPNMDSDVSPFCLAQSYMKHFDLEAAYVGERSKVEAAVYFYLLTQVLALRAALWSIRSHDRSCLLEWLDKHDLKGDDLFVATVEKITRMVPDVDTYYKIVKNFTLPSLSSHGKNLFERILTRMQKQFPEDPFSYLQLARLYRNKGAYRKSQKILEEAWNQAPYDPQVREYYGLGLLKASIMSRRRRSFAVARKDLEEAVNLNVKSLLPLINAVQATSTLFEKAGPDSFESALSPIMALSDPVLRARSLVCFFQDLSETTEPSAEKFARQVKQRVHKDLKSGLGRLSDSELIEIITPLPEDFAYLIGKFDELEFFEDLWTQVLGKLDDQHVLNVYTRLLARTGEFVQIKWVKKDLKKRLKRQQGNIYLQFFSVLADYVLDPDEGADGFNRLVRKLNDEDRQRLKDFCRKIASLFDEPLSHALGAFNFVLLDEDGFMFEPDFFDEDEEEWLEGEEEMTPDFMEHFLGEDPGKIIMEGLKRTGGNKELLQFLFEMLTSQISDFGLDDESLREMGRSMEKSGKEMVHLLRQIYSGAKGKRIGREGRLILFPDGK